MLEHISTISVLLGAAFLAGGMNAVAGGGSFLTLPALIFAGVPPVAANATGTVALIPGYLSSAYGFRRDLDGAGGVSLAWLTAATLIGGLIGSGLLVFTPDATFRVIVPWLLLAATALFAFGPHLSAMLRRFGAGSPAAMLAGLFAVSIYGGYFNGGVGILMLAHFSLCGLSNLTAMNSLKAFLSVALAVIGMVAYAAGGAVHWSEAALMACAALIGGYAGACVARRIPAVVLRVAIVIIGLIMSVGFFLK